MVAFGGCGNGSHHSMTAPTLKPGATTNNMKCFDRGSLKCVAVKAGEVIFLSP